MQDTGISQEILTLREQIAVAEATIEGHKSQGGLSNEAANADLGELVEARDFMVARLRRLQSCKRTPGT